MTNILFYLDSYDEKNFNEHTINFVSNQKNKLTYNKVNPFSSNSYDKFAKMAEEKILAKYENDEKYNTISSVDYMDIYRNEGFYKKLS